MKSHTALATLELGPYSFSANLPAKVVEGHSRPAFAAEDLLLLEFAAAWENGKADPGVALWNTVAQLALEAMEGSTRTVDRLRATQTEKPAGRVISMIKVDLNTLRR